MENRQQAQIEKLGYLSERRVKEKELEALEDVYKRQVLPPV